MVEISEEPYAVPGGFGAGKITKNSVTTAYPGNRQGVHAMYFLEFRIV